METGNINRAIITKKENILSDCVTGFGNHIMPTEKSDSREIISREIQMDRLHIIMKTVGQRKSNIYRVGIRQKTWKKYDEQGIPVLLITYKDDVETSINGVKINLPERDVKLIK